MTTRRSSSSSAPGYERLVAERASGFDPDAFDLERRARLVAALTPRLWEVMPSNPHASAPEGE